MHGAQSFGIASTNCRPFGVNPSRAAVVFAPNQGVTMQGPSLHVQRGRMRRSTLLAVQPKAQTRVGPWRRPVVARAVTAAALPDDQGLFVLQRARQWLSWDSDSSTRAVIQRLVDANDLQELSTLFSTRLEFGTAGLRGRMGAGTACMNALVVQQTSQGLAAYLKQHVDTEQLANGVVIGHDARHNSRAWAELTARVMQAAGLRVHLFSRIVPTPFVAAGVSLLKAAGGVMVTASHNPKEYNGYKVYWGNGCQIIPPHDYGIAASIEANLEPWKLPEGPVYSLMGVFDPLEYVASAYYTRLVSSVQCNPTALNAAAARVVYTPLHGVGADYVKEAFQVLQLPEPHLVPQQAAPHPDFPTVAFPNPEEGKGVWNLSFAAADAQGARLTLANDPDADRLAVAERCAASPGGWRLFDGNQIGILLAHWLWQNRSDKEPGKALQYAMLASTVSSKMIKRMAEKEGFVFQETLTGFKWLGNAAQQLEAGLPVTTAPNAAASAKVALPKKTVLFAFEEALGFMLGAMFRDKDGVAAAASMAELAAKTYAQGSSLGSVLDSLYERYGFHDYRTGYFLSDGTRSRAVFDGLRSGGHYAKAVAGVPVVAVRDLGTGLDTSRPDGHAILPWTPGDMAITYTLEGNATLTLRASGTEPKLKYYLEVAGEDRTAVQALASRLQVAVADKLLDLQRHGLRRPDVA